MISFDPKEPKKALLLKNEFDRNWEDGIDCFVFNFSLVDFSNENLSNENLSSAI
jgi:hypothetical protein